MKRGTDRAEARNEIYRQVLFDGLEDEIIREAVASGIPLAEARKLYAEARKQRVAQIRSQGLRQLLWGMLFIAAGAALWQVYVWNFRWVTRQMLFFVFAPVAWGGFCLLRGMNNFFLPHWKTGSIAVLD